MRSLSADDPLRVWIGPLSRRRGAAARYLLQVASHSRHRLHIAPEREPVVWALRWAGRRIPLTPCAYPAYERVVRGIRVAHIHRSPEYAEVLGSWPRGLPWVLTLHGFYVLESWRHRPDLTAYFRQYNRTALEAAQAAPVTTVVARWMREFLEARTAACAAVVPPGVDVAELGRATAEPFLAWSGLPPGYVLQVWRSAQGEGLEWYVRLASRFPDRAVVLLTDRAEADLRRETKTPWPGNFRCVTRLPRALTASALHGCAAYASTLLYDATGSSLAEALACGKPVAGPDRMGPHELLSDSRGGFLYDPASFEAFAESVGRAVDHPEAGLRGRAFVRGQRTWERTAATFDRIYEELAEATRRGHATSTEAPADPSRTRATRERHRAPNVSRE